MSVKNTAQNYMLAWQQIVTAEILLTKNPFRFGLERAFFVLSFCCLRKDFLPLFFAVDTDFEPLSQKEQILQVSSQMTQSTL